MKKISWEKNVKDVLLSFEEEIGKERDKQVAKEEAISQEEGEIVDGRSISQDANATIQTDPIVNMVNPSQNEDN